MPDLTRDRKKPGPKPVDWKSAFLRVLRSSGGVVQHACDAVGIARATAYSARAADAEFAKEWGTSKEAAIDDAEAHLLDLAMGRIQRPVWFKGRRVGSEPLISETALLAFLAARRPETWGRRVHVTCSSGAPLPFDTRSDAFLEAMTDEELEACRRRLDDLNAARSGSGADEA